MSLHPVTQFNMAIQVARGFVYESFRTYEEFKRFHLSVPDSSHYEIIEGRQNLYFDFDGEINLIVLTEAIKKVVNMVPIRIDVYSSCDRIKKSYHVVVKGVCYPDHITCGSVARSVIQSAQGANPSLSDSFDASVYSSKRNLRLLGSRKLDSTRVKIFHSTVYRDPAYNSPFESDQLWMSLVSATSRCKLIETAMDPTSPTTGIAATRSIGTMIREEQLTQDEIAHAMTLINDLIPGVFSRREVKGKSLFLKREKPAQCPICERVHHSDNAVVSLGGSRSGWTFRCLRDTTRSIQLLRDDEEVILPLVTKLPSSEPVGKTQIELYAEWVARRYSF